MLYSGLPGKLAEVRDRIAHHRAKGGWTRPVQIVAVTRVDHRPVGTGRIGPIAEALRTLYFDVVRGRRPEYRHWCAPVYATAAAPGTDLFSGYRSRRATAGTAK